MARTGAMGNKEEGLGEEVRENPEPCHSLPLGRTVTFVPNYLRP